MKRIISGVGIRIGIFAVAACTLGFFLGSACCARTAATPQADGEIQYGSPELGRQHLLAGWICLSSRQGFSGGSQHLLLQDSSFSNDALL